MNKCLFCSNPADSLERVLPQWLFRRVAPQTGGKLQVRVGRYVDGQGYRDQRRHISLAFKARIVCAQCNNGWMAKLESKVAHLLEHLVAPQFPAGVWVDLAKSKISGIGAGSQKCSRR
jgi:hypothetical protein